MRSIGETRIVFSTNHKPQSGKRLVRDETKVLLCNDLHLPVAKIIELYLLRWQIELFFKELKSQLGMHHYRFREPRCVQAWMQFYRLTFLYLEYFRAKRLRKAKTARQRQWWRGQRTYGLSLAIRQQLEEAQLLTLQRQTTTDTGLRKLRALLRKALPTEYRNTG